MNYFQMVYDFHKKVGQPIKLIPQPISLNEWRMRHDLLREEYEEYKHSKNIIDVADAFADMIYVIIGTCLALGIDIDKVFEEVHRSNMTKKGENKREDGKILKDKDYSPPDIAKVLSIDKTGFNVVK